MMDIITERLYALTEAMKEDSDYIRYLQLEEELERDKELKKKWTNTVSAIIICRSRMWICMKQ